MFFYVSSGQDLHVIWKKFFSFTQEFLTGVLLENGLTGTQKERSRNESFKENLWVRGRNGIESQRYRTCKIMV